MCMQRVLKCFTNIVSLSLTGCTTQLNFDNFISDPILLNNGTTQRDSSLMDYYRFYNTPLIETASLEDELSLGFIDNSMMLTVGDSLEQCNERLKDMMECPKGGFEWLLTHNSPFKLSEVALMYFPRLHRDHIPGALSLNKPNPDSTVSMSLTHPVNSYKYLGVIFDPKLCWPLQQMKALTTMTFWSSHIWHLSKSASRVTTAGAKQLYDTVAIPRFTYGVEIWYAYLHKLKGANKMKGSIALTNKLHSVQHKVAKAITSSLSSTVGNIFDVHAYILPIDLLLCKLLFRAALHLCSLPPSHPLHLLLLSASCHKVKCHLSPIHHLIWFAHINPKDIETVSPIKRSPGYTPSFKMVIPSSKDEALTFEILTNMMVPVHVYSDGSRFKGGIRASILIYIKEWLVKVLWVHLGSALKHTVYEVEGVGLVVGLHLLNGLTQQLTHTTILGTDSQAVIQVLSNQQLHMGQCILDAIYKSAK